MTTFLRLAADSSSTLMTRLQRQVQEGYSVDSARGISIQDVISDLVFTSSEEALEVDRLLSKTAIEMNMTQVIAELGQVEAMGTGYLDPLSDVLEVTPVKKLAVSRYLDFGYFHSDQSCPKLYPRRLSMKMATLSAHPP